MKSRPMIIIEAGTPSPQARIIDMKKTKHLPDAFRLWMGDSIARWEGDTLVIDTIGFNGKTQLDTEGNPLSEQLHVIERLTRTDATHMTWEITIDDPKTYVKTWKNVRTFTIYPNWELQEYVCNENNKDIEHLVNGNK